tara:strand:- start:11392 stop:12324 length:933 start_codon:yes stop_codon:yes gene_type:complete
MIANIKTNCKNLIKMNTKNLLLLIILFSFSSIQSQKKQDLEAIKKMCGCFEIDFNFAETFQFSNDSNYTKSKNYNAKALEYAKLIKDEKGHISIQHLLVMGDYVIKHWRQDWIYENKDLLKYDAENNWKYISKSKKDVKGQWTQKVFQVDDSPRYEGTSSWVHVDGKSYWENSTYAPLPRREYTKRNDYNIMIRGNKHEIVDDGWIHDQDNMKIVKNLENNSEIRLAAEKGLNKYTRVEDSKCDNAISWWEENKNKWSIVRNKWDFIYSKKNDISLRRSFENKPLFSYLFDENVTQKEEIGLIIDRFVID